MIKTLPYSITSVKQLAVNESISCSCASGVLQLDYTLPNWSSYSITIRRPVSDNDADKVLLSQSDDLAWHAPQPFEPSIVPAFDGLLKGFGCPADTVINQRILDSNYFYCNVAGTVLHVKVWRADGAGFSVSVALREQVYNEETFNWRFVHDEPPPTLPPEQEQPPP